MEGLPRPEVPPGAHRDLVDALHGLHHEAGWPSLRALAQKAGCSHTTVSTVFSSPRVPSWGVLELVVEAMGGDRGEFHRLWLLASSPAASSPAAAVRIAGRRTELAAVRRHLQRGAGLLLVMGEAGIGKTRLVDAAADSTPNVFVSKGACLPLSAQVPLLPATDVLRSIYEADHGDWIREALAGCPVYVEASLRRVLPELDAVGDPTIVPMGDLWRQRLFAAVDTVLSALGAVRPLGLVVEDLHWADSATLDLIEYLLARPPVSPLVATYRLGDASTPVATCEWLARVRRLPTVTTLELGPLTRDECAELLELIDATRTSGQVDRIYERSAGLPLFAEQLAAQEPDDEALPGLLADLLDRRLAAVDPDAWAVARALGVADRSLTDLELRTVSGLPRKALTAGLHALDEQRLTVTAGAHDVRLRHPLFGEAVRRRLVAGEAADEHRRLAQALALAPDPSAAEIAEHWQRGDDREQELIWRIRAAQGAGLRFAAAQEADQWRRALQLWPNGMDEAGAPAVRRVDAYVAAIEAAQSVDWRAAASLADQALAAVGTACGPGVAEIYLLAGEVQGNLADPEAGIALVERAVRLADANRELAVQVKGMLTRAYLLGGLDRPDVGDAAFDQAVALSARLEDPVTVRRALVAQAAHDAECGKLELALTRIEDAARLETAGPDPRGVLAAAVFHTNMLLTACRSADEVVAAGQHGLEEAAAWGIDDFLYSVLLANMSISLRRAGRVQEALRLVEPATQGSPTPHRWASYAERGRLDLLRGRRDEATRLHGVLSTIFVVDLPNRVECAQDAPIADLWCGRPGSAYDRLTAVLRDLGAVEDTVVDAGGLLVLAARAAADVADLPAPGSASRSALTDELETLFAGVGRDPFVDPDVFAERPALRAAWAAEMSRLSVTPSLERWVAAAAAWDRIGRPHDSAYCRWRGAQVALATGRASVATTLLRRAERDAREHVPLLEAIRGTDGARAQPQRDR